MPRTHIQLSYAMSAPQLFSRHVFSAFVFARDEGHLTSAKNSLIALPTPTAPRAAKAPSRGALSHTCLPFKGGPNSASAPWKPQAPLVRFLLLWPLFLLFFTPKTAFVPVPADIYQVSYVFHVGPKKEKSYWHCREHKI